MSDDSLKLVSALADKMIRDAEEQVAKAQLMLDQTKALVEIINNQVAAQAKQNADMVGRFEEAGEVMARAYRILDGNKGLGEQGTAALKPASLSDAARRGSFAGAGLPPNRPAGIGTLPADLTRDPKRDPDANYPARQAGGLPRAVAGNSEFDPRRDRGENHRDPGVSSKQPDRD